MPYATAKSTYYYTSRGMGNHSLKHITPLRVVVYFITIYFAYFYEPTWTFNSELGTFT
jgi:hypothetical protein